jgi:hypothetical protein
MIDISNDPSCRFWIVLMVSAATPREQHREEAWSLARTAQIVRHHYECRSRQSSPRLAEVSGRPYRPIDRRLGG